MNSENIKISLDLLPENFSKSKDYVIDPVGRGRDLGEYTFTGGETFNTPVGKVNKYKETIGKKIKKGDTIMIVEAMKTMNHVPSTSDGVVKEIIVEDGQPVEFGQVLVILE